ncbi:transporter substrate-binding domain-containing protein [Pseudoalteromonas rubra]|uniref:Transporter substrate-binding domain-containing protein n=1 Tax=Pseudoalteromonas rubra TaxID=43658 RepID=A0A5S3UZQ0_9GAMM|nr:transporter substrate-binding domain-containing protein [Pseudoalteromonas rubra]QPB83720.1 transporter substrate-binding domain-containing protein [Pseudoalteromonas rubra]
MHATKALLLFCIFFGISPLLFAQQIKVVTEHFPPYQIVENGLPIQGSAVELVKKQLSKANYKVPIEVYPWARAYKLALNEPNTMIFSLARTKEREHLFHWVGPISKLKGHIWALTSSSHIEINALADAKHFSIAVIREDSTHHFLRYIGFNDESNLYLTTTFEQNVQMLFLKRVDLVIGTQSMLEEQMSNLGLDIKKLRKIYTFGPDDFQLYIAFNNDTSLELVYKFQRILEEIQQSHSH